MLHIISNFGLLTIVSASKNEISKSIFGPNRERIMFKMNTHFFDDELHVAHERIIRSQRLGRLSATSCNLFRIESLIIIKSTLHCNDSELVRAPILS